MSTTYTIWNWPLHWKNVACPFSKQFYLVPFSKKINWQANRLMKPLKTVYMFASNLVCNNFCFLIRFSWILQISQVRLVYLWGPLIALLKTLLQKISCQFLVWNFNDPVSYGRPSSLETMIYRLFGAREQDTKKAHKNGAHKLHTLLPPGSANGEHLYYFTPF